MLSACLPLQDGGLSWVFKRQRVHLHVLHVGSKPIQKIIYRFEVCFDPSIEISIWAGASDIRSRPPSAGYMNELDSSPMAPIRIQSLPAVSQKFSPGWLSGNINSTYLYQIWVCLTQSSWFFLGFTPIKMSLHTVAVFPQAPFFAFSSEGNQAT